MCIYSINLTWNCTLKKELMYIMNFLYDKKDENATEIRNG